MTPKKLSIILLSILVLTGFGVFWAYKQYKILSISEVENTFPLINNEKENTDTTETVEEKVSQEEISKLPGCTTAFYELPKELKDITVEAKNKIINYRQSWQDVCSGKSLRSLYPLWVEAKKIIEWRGEGEGYKLCFASEAYDECSDITPYTPGFAGIYAEGILQNFTWSQEKFAQNTLIGTQEDKDFFNTFTNLNIENSSNFSPWVEQTWDYGGCTKYGSYNWVKTLNALDDLSKKVKSPVYLEEINLHRSHLLTGVTNHLLGIDFETPVFSDFKPSICTCGKKEDVLNDLESISKYAKTNLFYFESRDTLTNQSIRIDELILEIKNGKVDIFSQAERHCSGG